MSKDRLETKKESDYEPLDTEEHEKKVQIETKKLPSTFYLKTLTTK